MSYINGSSTMYSSLLDCLPAGKVLVWTEVDELPISFEASTIFSYIILSSKSVRWIVFSDPLIVLIPERFSVQPSIFLYYPQHLGLIGTMTVTQM